MHSLTWAKTWVQHKAADSSEPCHGTATGQPTIGQEAKSRNLDILQCWCPVGVLRWCLSAKSPSSRAWGDHGHADACTSWKMGDYGGTTTAAPCWWDWSEDTFPWGLDWGIVRLVSVTHKHQPWSKGSWVACSCFSVIQTLWMEVC